MGLDHRACDLGDTGLRQNYGDTVFPDDKTPALPLAFDSRAGPMAMVRGGFGPASPGEVGTACGLKRLKGVGGRPSRGCPDRKIRALATSGRGIDSGDPDDLDPARGLERHGPSPKEDQVNNRQQQKEGEEGDGAAELSGKRTGAWNGYPPPHRLTETVDLPLPILVHRPHLPSGSAEDA